MSHWDNLSRNVDLSHAKILDIGSGKGDFLIDATKRGADIVGIEFNPEYIQVCEQEARREGIMVNVKEGRAEALPFENDSFDFINLCEVIEHVESASTMLHEVRRVLRKKGTVYMSVPNRFGLRDPHFHLYFVNWLPRFMSDAFISLFGTHKDYEDISAGRQRLKDMHYYTLHSIQALVKDADLRLNDARIVRIKSQLPPYVSTFALVVYIMVRPWYFDSFHVLLRRP